MMTEGIQHREDEKNLAWWSIGCLSVGFVDATYSLTQSILRKEENKRENVVWEELSEWVRTCVSVRCSDAAKPALSLLDKYLFTSKVDSSWNTWLREKTVRVFFFLLLAAPFMLLPLLDCELTVIPDLLPGVPWGEDVVAALPDVPDPIFWPSDSNSLSSSLSTSSGSDLVPRPPPPLSRMSIELARELGRLSEEQQSDTPVSAGDFCSGFTAKPIYLNLNVSILHLIFSSLLSYICPFIRLNLWLILTNWAMSTLMGGRWRPTRVVCVRACREILRTCRDRPRRVPTWPVELRRSVQSQQGSWMLRGDGKWIH